MAETRVRGRVVTPTGVIDDGLVVVSGRQIEYVGRAAAFGPAHGGDGLAAEVHLPARGLVLPGLVDIHNHGGGGGAFTADRAGIDRAARHHLGHGSTSVVAGVVTDSPEAMLAAVATAADAVEDGSLAGIHLEGPFLSRRCCGAQDPRHLRAPDTGLAHDLLAAGRGHVRAMTLAPELPGAEGVAGLLLEDGVVPAVGHTEADAGLVRRTLAAARATLGRPALVTHLFNGMPPLHHRDPGPVAGALSAAAAGDTFVELIADGVHLDDETVRMVLEMLGPERVVLVTDAMAAAGMPDGSYDLGPQRVEVTHGVARVGKGSEAPLAGGTSHLLDVVRRCVHAGIDLASAVSAASSTPAKALVLDDQVGSLQPGRSADLLLLAEDLDLVRVMRAGEWVRARGRAH